MTALGQKLLKAIESNNTKWFERLLKTQKSSVAPLDSDWIFYHACNKQRVEIIDLILQDPRFDSSIGNPYTIPGNCGNGNWAVISRLIQDKRFDSSEFDLALQNATIGKSAATVDLLLQNKKIDTHRAIYACRAPHQFYFDPKCDKLLDALLAHSQTDLQKIPFEIYRIGQIKTRCYNVCIGLQDLNLPALITLEILDQLICWEIAHCFRVPNNECSKGMANHF